MAASQRMIYDLLTKTPSTEQLLTALYESEKSIHASLAPVESSSAAHDNKKEKMALFFDENPQQTFTLLLSSYQAVLKVIAMRKPSAADFGFFLHVKLCHYLSAAEMLACTTLLAKNTAITDLTLATHSIAEEENDDAKEDPNMAKTTAALIEAVATNLAAPTCQIRRFQALTAISPSSYQRLINAIGDNQSLEHLALQWVTGTTTRELDDRLIQLLRTKKHLYSLSVRVDSELNTSDCFKITSDLMRHTTLLHFHLTPNAFGEGVSALFKDLLQIAQTHPTLQTLNGLTTPADMNDKVTTEMAYCLEQSLKNQKTLTQLGISMTGSPSMIAACAAIMSHNTCLSTLYVHYLTRPEKDYLKKLMAAWRSNRNLAILGLFDDSNEYKTASYEALLRTVTANPNICVFHADSLAQSDTNLTARIATQTLLNNALHHNQVKNLAWQLVSTTIAFARVAPDTLRLAVLPLLSQIVGMSSASDQYNDAAVEAFFVRAAKPPKLKLRNSVYFTGLSQTAFFRDHLRAAIIENAPLPAGTKRSYSQLS